MASEASKAQALLRKVLKEPGNGTCADCDSQNPRWASVNLGIFICVSCAGFHRSLGPHISKVRSVSLDKWKVEQAKNMKGNIAHNALYEGRLDDKDRIGKDTSSARRGEFIREKYIDRKFYYMVKVKQREEEMMAKAKKKAASDDRKRAKLLEAVKSKDKTKDLASLVQKLSPSDLDLVLDDNDNTAIILAAKANNAAGIKLLVDAKANINAQNKDDVTALIYAAKLEKLDSVHALLECKADVTMENKNGLTAGLCAALMGKERSLRVVLPASNDITATDKNGWTGLMLACKKGHTKAATVMLEAKADVDASSKSGNTALIVASKFNQEACVKLLLDAKADTSLRDQHGKGPVEHATAAKADSIVKLLQK